MNDTDNAATPNAETSEQDFQATVNTTLFSAIATKREQAIASAKAQLESGDASIAPLTVDVGIRVVLEALDELKATVTYTLNDHEVQISHIGDLTGSFYDHINS